MDLALDPNAVYFTSVDEEVAAVEAPSSGPRRIYMAQSDPNDVFVADPFAGRTDLAPWAQCSTQKLSGS